MCEHKFRQSFEANSLSVGHDRQALRVLN